MAKKLNLFLFGLIGIALIGFLGWQLQAAWTELGQAHDSSQAAFVGSAACADCHIDRESSWYATYHRTMTQMATVETVQGQFDGQALDYAGIRMRPVQENGRFFFDYYDLESGEKLNRLSIDKTVGSHRYQQYLTRLPEDQTHVRLHYLWHNRDQRWVHMNGVFLGHDGMDYDQHIAVWNQNCVFCHNTGPQPRVSNYEELQERARRGEQIEVALDTRFETVVAELGISCETCHGPGERHVELAASAWNRAVMRIAPGRDQSIVNPVRLDAQLGTHVCAQCHAQRTFPDIETLRQMLDTGPTFRPGDNLHDHVIPVQRDTQVPFVGHDDLFKLRFWADGTPRLTAYEYQGFSASTCYQQAQFSCMDCHTMHAGDPAGQLTDRTRGNAPCLRCHQDFRRETDLVAHTQHPADSAGSLCYNCHMPHLKYGVMDIHRSHRIEVPDAKSDALAGRPNACLNCHVEEAPQWAADALANWYGPGPAVQIPFRQDGGPLELAELATVLVGDPVQKSILAWRAGHADLSQRGRDRAWMLAYLIEAMEDIYPATRRFSALSFRAILDDWPEAAEVGELGQALARFDFMGAPADRAEQMARLRASWLAIDKSAWPPPPLHSGVGSDFVLPADLRDALVELGRRQDKQIAIGE
ncbi:MAG: cytochrome c3 family protein [Wenzhouxiangella sp.]